MGRVEPRDRRASHRRRALSCMGGACLGLLWAVEAAAEPPPPRSASGGWEVTVSPYVWATAIDGEVQARGATVDVDSDFGDIVEKLNLGLMGLVEVRRDRFVALFDGFWARLEDEFEAGPRNLAFGPRTVRGGPRGAVQLAVPRVEVPVGPLEVEAELEEVILDLKLGYRVLSHSLDGAPDPADRDARGRFLEVDLLAGARYWYLRTEIDVALPAIQVPGFAISPSVPAFPRLALPDVRIPGVTFGGIDRTFEESTDWVDPVVGGRVRADLGDRVSVVFLGDVGGFGIGSASDFTWTAWATVAYRLGDHWSLGLGYKAQEIDRESADLLTHGPVLGLRYRF